MGLLDQLQSGGAPSGLLDLLRNSALNQNLNMGIGSDVASYGGQPPMPPSATGQASGSLSAPAQGSPNPQQAPMSATGSQAQDSSFPAFDFNHRLLTGLHGFTGNMSLGPIGAVMGGIGALVTGQRTDPAGKSIADLIRSYQVAVRNGGVGGSSRDDASAPKGPAAGASAIPWNSLPKPRL